jgi:hypothetical protein
VIPNFAAVTELEASLSEFTDPLARADVPTAPEEILTEVTEALASASESTTPAENIAEALIAAFAI